LQLRQHSGYHNRPSVGHRAWTLFEYFHGYRRTLGSYFSDFIEPIAKKIQEYTAPIKPFLDFITAPIPVISDLAGPTSLLDIAALSGEVNP